MWAVKVMFAVDVAASERRGQNVRIPTRKPKSSREETARNARRDQKRKAFAS